MPFCVQRSAVQAAIQCHASASSGDHSIAPIFIFWQSFSAAFMAFVWSASMVSNSIICSRVNAWPSFMLCHSTSPWSKSLCCSQACLYGEDSCHGSWLGFSILSMGELEEKARQMDHLATMLSDWHQ